MAQLERTWSTEHTQPGRELSYWKDVICENLLDLQIDSAQQANFHGRIAKCSLGASAAWTCGARCWRTKPRACTKASGSREPSAPGRGTPIR